MGVKCKQLCYVESRGSLTKDSRHRNSQVFWLGKRLNDRKRNLLAHAVSKANDELIAKVSTGVRIYSKCV